MRDPRARAEEWSVSVYCGLAAWGIVIWMLSPLGWSGRFGGIERKFLEVPVMENKYRERRIVKQFAPSRLNQAVYL